MRKERSGRARAAARAWLALLVAATGSVAFAVLFGLAQGRPLDPGYIAFCSGLTLAAASMLAAAGMLVAGAGLAAWAGLSAALMLGSAAGAALMLTSFALLRLAQAAGAGTLRLAVAVTLALAVGLVCVPHLLGGIGLAEGHPLVGAAGVVTATLLLAALLLGPRLAVRWLPEKVLATGSVLVVTLVALATLGSAPHRGAVLPITPPGPQKPSVIVLLLDTVAANHLSVYGYERETTPHLARFLARHDRAVLYPHAYAPATWTLPTHASLFTGTMPSEHGIHAASMFTEDARPVRRTLAATQTLAERLRSSGYRTASFYANDWLEHVEGLERGFDVYEHVPSPGPLPLLGEELRHRFFPSRYVRETARTAPAGVVSERLLSYVKGSCTQGGCFVFANYMDAHAPYHPPEPFAGTFTESALVGPPARTEHTDDELRELSARYDETILALDAAIGSLLEQLEARGLMDDAWLVITSDHGEAFGEHGVTEHGTTVHGEVTRVPLLVQPPRGVHLPPQDGAVSLLDLTATLARVGGGAALGQGRDLQEPWSRPGTVPIEFYGSRKAHRHGALAAFPARAVVRGVHKLIESEEGRSLYRVDVDPGEEHDLAPMQRPAVRRLTGLLPSLEERAPERDLGEPKLLRLSANQEAALRALGYIE